MEIPAYADTTFSADVTPTEINLGNPLEGYSPANISGTVTIKNTGAGVLSFAVDTEDSGYSDFNRYFTVNVAGAQNIASGSSGSVTVSPKAGLLEGEYTGRFYLVDKIDDTNALMLSPVTVTFKVSKKGDGTVEGVRSPEGEYTPGQTRIKHGIAGDSLYSIAIDGKTAYCANYNYSLNTGSSSLYENKFGLIPDVTNKELDSYTGMPDPFYTNGRIYPPNDYGYTPVKVGSDTSTVRDQVAKVLYYGYPNDALNIRTSGNMLANDNNYNYVLINQGRKDYVFMIATQCAIWHYTDGIDFSDIASAKNDDARATHIKDIYQVIPNWGWKDVQNLYNLLIENPAEILSTTDTFGVLHGYFKNGYTLGMKLKDPPEDFVVNLYVADNPINISGTPTWTQNLVAADTKAPSDEKVSISVTKIWNDSSNAAANRPNSEQFKSWVHLYLGSTEVTDTYADNLQVTDNGNNTYTIEYSQLPASTETYTIQEVIPQEYADKYKISPETGEIEDGGSLTNTSVTYKVNDAYLTLRKENKSGELLEGARFTMYADAECTTPISALNEISAANGTARI